MPSLAQRFRDGQTFDEMLATATSSVALSRGIRAHCSAPAGYAERIAATGRRWHLLVISEDWCGDAVNIVPWVDALDASSAMTEMRIIARDRNLDLMDQHLTNGLTRSIPIVLLLDDRYVERAWWGPRPRAIQAWFESPEVQALSHDERYKALRTLYARDRGVSILEELTRMIEEVAAQDASAESARAQAVSSA